MKKNPDDSARIAWGLGGYTRGCARVHPPSRQKSPRRFCLNRLGAQGSCRVHKPGVPHGPASQKKLGPTDNIANNAQLLGQPKYLNKRLEGRSNLRPEGLAEEERRPLPTPARLSDQKAWPRRNSTPSPNPTYASDRGCTEPLLTAPLRLAQSELTGTHRPGTPAR